MKPPTVHEDLGSVSTAKAKFVLNSLDELRHMGRVQTDQDVADRIDAYFDFCSKHGLRPGIEQLALSMGVSRITLYKWRKGIGCSPEREYLIKQATQFIYAYLEALGIAGQLNPATFIWASKQWMSYKDGYGFDDAVPDKDGHEAIDLAQLADKLGIEDRFKSLANHMEADKNLDQPWMSEEYDL